MNKVVVERRHVAGHTPIEAINNMGVEIGDLYRVKELVANYCDCSELHPEWNVTVKLERVSGGQAEDR